MRTPVPPKGLPGEAMTGSWQLARRACNPPKQGHQHPRRSGPCPTPRRFRASGHCNNRPWWTSRARRDLAVAQPRQRCFQVRQWHSCMRRWQRGQAQPPLRRPDPAQRAKPRRARQSVYAKQTSWNVYGTPGGYMSSLNLAVRQVDLPVRCSQ